MDAGTDVRKFVRGRLIHTAALVIRDQNSSACIQGILQDKIWPFTGSMPTVYLQLFYRTGSTVPFDLPQIQIHPRHYLEIWRFLSLDMAYHMTW